MFNLFKKCKNCKEHNDLEKLRELNEDYICWDTINYYVEDFAIVITDGESLFGDRQLVRGL